jgi:hypothetical protein
MINGRLSFLIPWLHANLRIRSIAGRMWNERVWLIVAAIVFACPSPKPCPARLMRPCVSGGSRRWRLVRGPSQRRPAPALPGGDKILRDTQNDPEGR